MDRSPYAVRQEMRRLMQLSRTQARAQFNDRLARASMLDGAEFAEALDFNARLVTALREVATEAGQAPVWGH